MENKKNKKCSHETENNNQTNEIKNNIDEKTENIIENKKEIDVSEMSKEQLLDFVNALKEENEKLINENEQFKIQIEALNKEKNIALQKSDDYLNKLAGLKNDFERYKTRTNSATDTAKDDGKIFVIEKLIPVLDTFDRAKESVTDEITIKALELILKQFEKVLNDIGIEEIEVLNQTFNPNYANAIVKQPVEEDTKKGVVLTVIAKGFKYKGKIIRYPQVIVGV